ncbi:hypothetical protein CBS101457_005004 [Exobasidium rhododendri]|nr:hypothetical protein CBS101457_005004 [Exobasidium rhododendri]
MFYDFFTRGGGQGDENALFEGDKDLLSTRSYPLSSLCRFQRDFKRTGDGGPVETNVYLDKLKASHGSLDITNNNTNNIIEMVLRRLHRRNERDTRLTIGSIGEEEPLKQWTRSPHGKKTKRKSYLLVLAGITAGILLGLLRLGLSVYHHFRDLGTYCLVFEDNFDGPLNTSLWKQEISVGGFGNNEFTWTTSSPNNTWTEDGNLYITPTFTSDIYGGALLNDGLFVNLIADGTCTTPESNTHTNCQSRSNLTLGTIVPPIQSARINTNGTASIRYGRVEFRLRIPTGDWIWPAVWMMPENSVYGDWPSSGEIDIFESRGNQAVKKDQQYSNDMTSTLHVGYDSHSNLSTKFLKHLKVWRNWFNEEFHTFGLEWDEKGLWTWEGNRNRRIANVKFDKYMIDRMTKQYDASGVFIPSPNPWVSSQSMAAPFDQKFFLIINVAVGGLNGYFADTHNIWSHTDPNGARSFWKNKDISWGPTWPKEAKARSLVMDYVKMWQRC